MKVEIPPELVAKFEASSFCPDDAIRGQPQTGTAWNTLQTMRACLFYVCHWNGKEEAASVAWGEASTPADAEFLKAAVDWFQSMTQAKVSHEQTS